VAILAPPAAISRGVWEDIGLVVFGLTAAVIALRRQSTTPPAPHITAAAERDGVARTPATASAGNGR
jgi:hypothetical protein